MIFSSNDNISNMINGMSIEEINGVEDDIAAFTRTYGGKVFQHLLEFACEVPMANLRHVGLGDEKLTSQICIESNALLNTLEALRGRCLGMSDLLEERKSKIRSQEHDDA